MVGSEYQAVIPDGLCRYGDALPYENEDRLVWDPAPLAESSVVAYQLRCSSAAAASAAAAVAAAAQQAAAQAAAVAAAAQQAASSTSSAFAEVGGALAGGGIGNSGHINGAGSLSPSSSAAAAAAAAAATAATAVATASTSAAAAAAAIAAAVRQLPRGSHQRDDEQSLYTLHQCGYNGEEALRRQRISSGTAATNGSAAAASGRGCEDEGAGGDDGDDGDMDDTDDTDAEARFV